MIFLLCIQNNNCPLVSDSVFVAGSELLAFVAERLETRDHVEPSHRVLAIVIFAIYVMS